MSEQFNFRKLATIPASTDVPQDGFRFAVLQYKTVNGVKKESVAYEVQDFLPIAADASDVERMIADLVARQQDAALREYDGGELEAGRLVEDVELLAKDYWTDGRGGGRIGVKQSQLMDWIDAVLMPAIVGRLKRNLAFTQQKRTELATALIGFFKIAGSRGNKIGNKSCSVAMLKDLHGRLNKLVEDVELDDSAVEFIALQQRIMTHVATLEQPEVTVEEF